MSALIFCGLLSKAQDYKTAIGLRGGGPSGLTVKHFIGGNAALEGILGAGFGGVEIVGLYEIHANAFDVPRLNWYYGGGAHVGGYNGGRRYRGYYYADNYIGIGVDGVVGIEYNIADIPINIGVDLQPRLNLVSRLGFWVNGGLSVRYYF